MSACSRGGMETRSVLRKIIATIKIQCALKNDKKMQLCMHYKHMSNCSAELFSRFGESSFFFFFFL